MLTKEYALVPLFEKFVKHSFSGKRLKADSSSIKRQTVNNYVYVLRYLKGYEKKYDLVLRVRAMCGYNKRLFIAEGNYWKNFTLRLPIFFTRIKIVMITMWVP